MNYWELHPSTKKEIQPHVTSDEHSNTVLEWWVKDHKLTMYPKENLLLQIWVNGSSLEIKELRLDDVNGVRDAFKWLYL